MKFEEILPALREGKKIRRKSWVDKRCYSFEGGNFIYYSNEPEIYFKQFMEEDILLADDWEVVKKVKLRDLTEEQYEKWQLQNCGGDKCNNCIFNKVNCAIKDYYWIKGKSLFSDKFLDQEIELWED